MGIKSLQPCINIPTHTCSRLSLDEKLRLSIPFLSTSQMTSHLSTELNEDVESFRCVIVLTVYCSQGWVQKFNCFSRFQVNTLKKYLLGLRASHTASTSTAGCYTYKHQSIGNTTLRFSNVGTHYDR